ncbi:MAG: hypothetical protein DMD91_28290 [Candidatus Rokuibacteriota bacterium]|nr:MAG: hypothetical protein DMD91_28290 [Candidatus Rokubacteria bacterium]
MTSELRGAPYSVEVSARRIRHYRYVEERMTRTMAGWIALTPELPAKLVLGRHVWDCAQHADAWGKRLPELRSPAQRSEPANDGVVRFMALVEAPDGPDQTAERLVSVYRVLKPHVLAVYERHLASANRVYEPPTIRILERCIADERRHVVAATDVLDRLIATDTARARVDNRERDLMHALEEAGGIAGDGDARRLSMEHPTGAASEMKIDDGRFEPSRLDERLRETIEAVGRAAAAGDASILEELVVADARETLVAAYAGANAAAIVACARIGEYRIVKLRLTGRSGGPMLQLQCRPVPDGWRVADARWVGEAPAL